MLYLLICVSIMNNLGSYKIIFGDLVNFYRLSFLTFMDIYQEILVWNRFDWTLVPESSQAMKSWSIRGKEAWEYLVALNYIGAAVRSRRQSDTNFGKVRWIFMSYFGIWSALFLVWAMFHKGHSLFQDLKWAIRGWNWRGEHGLCGHFAESNWNSRAWEVRVLS